MNTQTAEKMPEQQTQRPASNALVEIQNELTGERMRRQLSMALPAHIGVDKFVRVAFTAVAKNAELAAADRGSLFTSCVECASDGLLPDGKEAALVIYNIRVKQRGGPDMLVKKVQYMPMIAGIHKKARNTGEISMLDAHVVYEKDQFDYALGLDTRLEHRPYLGDRGNAVAVYAVAKLKDGTHYVEVMSVSDVEHVRKASKNAEKGPWADWWGEMARKTVVRRLAKRLPMSAELETMIQRVDALYNFDESKEPRLSGPAPARPQIGNYAPQPVAAVDEALDDEPPAPPTQQPAAHPWRVIDEFGEIVEEVSFAGTWCDAIIYHMGRVDTAEALDNLMRNNSETLDRLHLEGKTKHLETVKAWREKREDELAATEPEPAVEPEPAAEPDSEPVAEPEADDFPGDAASDAVNLSVPVTNTPAGRIDWITYTRMFKRKIRETARRDIEALRRANEETLAKMREQSKANHDSLFAAMSDREAG